MRRNQIPMSQGHSNGLGEHGVESDSRFRTPKLRRHMPSKEQVSETQDPVKAVRGRIRLAGGSKPSSGVISANERNPKIRPTDIG